MDTASSVDVTTAAAAAAERRLRALGASGPGLTPAESTTGTSGGGVVTEAGSPAGQPAVQAAVYCYGRVAADAAPPPGSSSPLYPVPLELEPGVFGELLSTQVYCFRSVVEGGSTVGPAAVGQAQVQLQPVPLQAQQPAGTLPQAATAAGTGGAATAGGATTGSTAGSSGGPGAAALVGAVRELLGAAGLPPDLRAEELLAKAAEAREALVEAKRGLEQVSALACLVCALDGEGATFLVGLSESC